MDIINNNFTFYYDKEKYIDLALQLHQCPLCSDTVKYNSNHLNYKHIQFGIELSDGTSVKTALPCKKIECRQPIQVQRSHFHCPNCGKTLSRSTQLKIHYKICARVASFTSNTNDVDHSNLVHNYSCPTCFKPFVSLTSLRRHIHEKHFGGKFFYPGVCVDEKDGLFLIAKSKTGLAAPVHVQKSMKKQCFHCSNTECIDLLHAASYANPGWECCHLQATEHAHFPDFQVLAKDSVSALVKLQIISSDTAKACTEMLEATAAVHRPLVVCADFTQLGEWSCQCPWSGLNKSCMHEALCKAYMLQFQPALFQIHTNRFQQTGTQMVKKDVQMMDYFFKAKLIPTDINGALLIEKAPEQPLTPSESTCPFCHIKLCDGKLTTTTIYGCGIAWRGINVITRTCGNCTSVFRFQDHQTGYHNFNNRIMLTLKLCMHLTNGVKHHVAVERSINILFNDQSVPISSIRNAFYHFLALQDVEYSFVCNRCGINPPIIIADGNWKNTCLRPVESTKNMVPARDDIDVEKTWNEYRKEIVGRGFYDNANNPWKVEVSYQNVAPWMGSSSRKSSQLPNTEHKKGSALATKLQPGKQEPKISHEELLLCLTHPEKTTTQDLQSLCKNFGLEAKGSAEDMINLLTELVLFKDYFPKAFRSIKKCGGGIVHFRCVHGVCSYMKCLIRQESARDYVDGILAYENRPKVFISDIPSQIALHGKQRKADMFAPFDGMLYKYCDENKELAAANSLPQVHIDLADRGHNYYSLCDAFHLKSKKKSISRSFRDVKNTDLLVNTSVCEQKNADMAKDRYTFCGMEFVNYMFMSRFVTHLRNVDNNKRFLKQLHSHFKKITFTKDLIAIPVRPDRTVVKDETSPAEKLPAESFQSQPACTVDEALPSGKLPAGSPQSQSACTVDEALPSGKLPAGSPQSQSACTVDEALPSGKLPAGSPQSQSACTVDDPMLRLKSSIGEVECQSISKRKCFGINSVANLNNTCAKVLTLWNEEDHQMVVSSIDDGKHILRHASFSTLHNQRWLDGSVIDFCLNMLAREHKKVFVLDSFITTLIVDNRETVKRHLLNKVRFCNYEVIVGAYNKDKCHWNLLFVHIPSQSCLLLEPFGSTLHRTKAACKSFSAYLQMRTNDEDRHLRSSKWTPLRLKHSKQTDRFNCGVIVVKMAELLLNGLPSIPNEIIWDSSTEALQNLRRQMAEKILMCSDNLEDRCSSCGMKQTQKIEKWVQCCLCSRWFHIICVNISTHHFLQVSKSEAVWNCAACTEHC